MKLHEGITNIETEITLFTKALSSMHNFSVLSFEIIELEVKSWFFVFLFFFVCLFLIHWVLSVFSFSFAISQLHQGYTPLPFQRLNAFSLVLVHIHKMLKIPIYIYLSWFWLGQS